MRIGVSELISTLSLCVCVCSDAGSLLQLVCEGDFEAVLFSSAVQGLLGACPEEGDSIEAYLERQVLLYLSDVTEEQRSHRSGFTIYDCVLSVFNYTSILYLFTILEKYDIGIHLFIWFYFLFSPDNVLHSFFHS